MHKKLQKNLKTRIRIKKYLKLNFSSHKSTRKILPQQSTKHDNEKKNKKQTKQDLSRAKNINWNISTNLQIDSNSSDEPPKTSK